MYSNESIQKNNKKDNSDIGIILPGIFREPVGELKLYLNMLIILQVKVI